MKIKKVYLWTQKIRPGHEEVTNYFPEMNSNTQDGFTATSSSLLNSTYIPYFAFLNRTWSPQAQPDKVFHSSSIWSWVVAWSQIQCPQKIQPTKIRIASRKADISGNQRPIRAFTLKWSNDWTNYTSILTQTGLQNSRWSYTTSNVLERDIPTSDAYQYLRLEVTSNGNYVAFNYWNIDWIK